MVNDIGNVLFYLDVVGKDLKLEELNGLSAEVFYDLYEGGKWKNCGLALSFGVYQVVKTNILQKDNKSQAGRLNIYYPNVKNFKSEDVWVHMEGKSTDEQQGTGKFIGLTKHLIKEVFDTQLKCFHEAETFALQQRSVKLTAGVIGALQIDLEELGKEGFITGDEVDYLKSEIEWLVDYFLNYKDLTRRLFTLDVVEELTRLYSKEFKTGE